MIEIGMAVQLNWQLFGEKFRNTEDNTTVIHNPLIVIRFLHSNRIVAPLANFSNERSTISFFDKNKAVEAIGSFLSLIAAYTGIFISLLWINRFFHENRLDIEWWYWPTGCMVSHLMFYTFPLIDEFGESIIAIGY
jgi:hypothetical protein